jgi:selenocysteine lyase/cysteine desulfurase
MTSRRTFLQTATQTLIGSFITFNIRNNVVAQNQGLPLILNNKVDWEQVRELFILSKKKLYFNTGTLGVSPKSVLDTVCEQMLKVETTGEYGKISAVRTQIAELVKVLESEICLTANTTTGINIVAQGIRFKKGDEIIITNQEHVGNALPWLQIAKIKGLKIKVLELASTSEKTLYNLEKLFSRKTKVVAVPHITCTTGQVLPIKAIAQAAHNHNALLFVDGAHGPGMLSLNLIDLGCDFYATSCHKWMLGPKGTGFLYVNKKLQESLVPRFVGSGFGGDWSLSNKTAHLGKFNESAERYEYGTQNTSLWAGVSETIHFINEIGMDKIERRILELSGYFQAHLLEMKQENVELLTPTEVGSWAGIQTFRLKNITHDDFAAKAAAQNIRIRKVNESNLNAIRVSTHIYNTYAEIDQLVALVKECSMIR